MTARVPTNIKIYPELLNRLIPIVAYRMKNRVWSRLHSIDQERERKPSMPTLTNEALEFYLDLIAPIESTPADRMADSEGNLDFRYVPWCGNTNTPETRQAFQEHLLKFTRETFDQWSGTFSERLNK